MTTTKMLTFYLDRMLAAGRISRGWQVLCQQPPHVQDPDPQDQWTVHPHPQEHGRAGGGCDHRGGSSVTVCVPTLLHISWGSDAIMQSESRPKEERADSCVPNNDLVVSSVEQRKFRRWSLGRWSTGSNFDLIISLQRCCQMDWRTKVRPDMAICYPWGIA